MIVMTVTLLRFPPGFYRDFKALLPGALLGNLTSYLLFGNLIILASFLLVRDEKMWLGLILVAAAPPAAAVLSLSDRVRADRMLTFAGFAGTHVAALILAPLIGIAFFKYIPVPPDKLIILTLSLIVLPLLFSHIVVDQDIETFIQRHEGRITDVSFFIVFYTLTAQNAGWIRQWPIDMARMAGIAGLSTILMGLLVFVTARLCKIPRQKYLSLHLMGTAKNYGLAGGIALYLFNPKMALPALIFAVFMFLHSIIIKLKTPRAGKTLSNQTPPPDKPQE